MASPQLAGFAAWLWALRPTLSMLQVKTNLQQTPQASAPASGAAGCDPATASAPVLDAYAAVLGADVPGNAPARAAILDVADDTGAVGANGAFDERDVEAFLDAFAESFGSQDWSRYDLNGDGTTGDDDTDPAATARIDLDVDDPPAFETVEQILPGDLVVSFEETAATDRDVLCYYAYSPLYTGDPDERDQLLEIPCCPEVEWVLTRLGGAAGEEDSVARAINDAGVVVGVDRDRAFRWTPLAGDRTQGVYEDLWDGYAEDVNSAGQILGASGGGAVLFEDGAPHAVGPAGFYAESLNDAGVVAGCVVNFLPGGAFTTSSTLVDGETVTPVAGDGCVAAINDTGALAGSARTSTLFAYRPAFWSAAGALPQILSGAGANGDVNDLNDAGLLVGSDRRPSPYPSYSQGGAGFAQLPTIPGGFHADEGDAYAVNEKGEIVGSLWLEATEEVLGERAVIWKDHVPTDLNTLLSPADAAGFVLAEALDLNERGQIVGWGVELPFLPFTYYARAFLLTPQCKE
jgi:uncharacterized membrane protein